MEQEKLEVQPEMDRSKIFFLLGKLSISLGCYHPNFEKFLEVLEPHKPKPDIQLSDIEKHFQYLQSSKNPLGKLLQKFRSQIFTYLYGKLVKLETNHQMHSKHLILCYKLFDARKPKKLTISEALLYQEKYIDRLTEMIQKLIHVNVTELQTSEMTSKINELCKMHLESKNKKNLNLKLPEILDNNEKELKLKENHKPIESVSSKTVVGFAYIENYILEKSYASNGLRWEKERRFIRHLPSKNEQIELELSSKQGDFNYEEKHQSDKMIILGFAHLEHYVKQFSYELKGFRWQQELKIVTDLPEHLNTEEESSIEEIDMQRDDEKRAEIVYAIDWEKRQYLLHSYYDSAHDCRMETTDFSSPSEKSYKTSVQSEQTEYSLEQYVHQQPQTEEDDDSLKSVVEELDKVQQFVWSPPAESMSSIQYKFQHQRYIIAAPRAVLQLFRCNPSYRCSPFDSNAPNFFEQLAQFSEITGLAGKNCALDTVSIRERVELTMRHIMYEPLWSPELCIRGITMIKLQELLTSKEQQEFELLRWHHRDCGVSFELSAEERQRDVLHGMLGSECLQLKPSALKYRLLLRSPHHQQSISDSFLLLSLGQVGYYYKSLQQQQLRLCKLGESGVILARCLREELLVLYKFHQQQQCKPLSLIRLYFHTRSLQLKFQWVLRICQGLTRKTPLLKSLHQQLCRRNVHYDELLQKWLLKASQPLLGRICRWLLYGEVPKSEHKDFFIVSHPWEGKTFFYWTSHFKLIVELLPPFLERKLAQLLLSVGRSHHYARKYLNLELRNSLKLEQLQQKLSEACKQFYQELYEQQIKEVLYHLQWETSGLLLQQLRRLSQTPLEILSKLHQYVLVTDMEFVRELIEKLEPALEQTAECFDLQQMNSMLEQLLGKHNEQLYVDHSKQLGKLCWSCFLLNWNLPAHWLALIGHRMQQYSSCFLGLWQFHHADYVLSERIRRHQTHFLERIGVKSSKDALLVGERFDQLIDKLFKFISTLRDYFFHDVLGNAFEGLYIACTVTKSLDELLDLHAEYLDGIEFGIIQTKLGLKSRQYLSDLYNIIFRLDTEQQKFLTLSQLIKRANNSASSKEFHWSCLNTCDVLNDLDEQFQKGLVNFLLALYSAGGEQYISLAKRLDHNRYYAKKFRQLEQVNTFRFERKLKLINCKKF